MNLTHAMKWKEKEQVFRCRTGACRYELTEDQITTAGYHPYKEGVIFFNEEDFDGLQAD